MGCCGQAEEGDEDKKARKQNKEIEKQIQKDKQVNVSVSVTGWQHCGDIMSSSILVTPMVDWLHWYTCI